MSAKGGLRRHLMIGLVVLLALIVASRSGPFVVREQAWCVDMATHRLVTDGRYVFAAGLRGGYSRRDRYTLAIFDSMGSDPSQEVGAVSFESEITDLHYQNSYIYALASGLYIIDVTDPQHAVTVSVSSEFRDAMEMAISDGLAAIRVNHRVEFVNISDVKHPRLAGGLVDHSSDSAWGIAMLDHYAYVMGDGLRVVDLSVRVSPREIATVNIPAPAAVSQSIAVDARNNLLYVVNIGLFVFDITDPTAPQLVWSGRSADEMAMAIGAVLGRPSFKTIRLGDRLAYVATQQGLLSQKLLAFDMANPESPRRLPRTLARNINPNFAVAGDEVYVAVHSDKTGCSTALTHLSVGLYPWQTH